MVCPAIAMKTAGKRKMHLVQTVLDPTTLRKLDALARAAGHKRAGYLRHLVEMHIQDLESRGMNVPGPGPHALLEDKELARPARNGTPGVHMP